MTSFNRALEKTFPAEGLFSDHPSDTGGRTWRGITEAVARANGYDGPMHQMPNETVIRIYRQQYWDIQRLDQVAQWSELVAIEVFDTGVNMGIGVAGRFLQRSLNVFNRKSTIYPDLTPDGIIGPVTILHLRRYLDYRRRDGEKVLLRALNGLQAARYIELAEGREANEDFVFGWILQRVELES